MTTRRRTRTYIDKLHPRDKPYEVRDEGSSKVPGLVVRIQPSGRKYFYVRYRRPVHDEKLNKDRDKPTQTCIGRSDHMSLDDARNAARVALSAVRLAVNSGLTGRNVTDQVAKTLLNLDRSVAEIEAEKAKQDNCPTLEKFIDDKYGPYLATEEKYAKDGREIARLKYILGLFKYQPGLDLLSMKVNEIDSERITDWLIKRRGTPSARTRKVPASMTIQRDLAAISGLFAHAIKPRKLISTNPVAEVEHKAADNRIDRYLSRKEEDRLLQALIDRESDKRRKRKSGNEWVRQRGGIERPEYPEGQFVDYVRPLVLTALHTGLRRGELLAITWKDVHLAKSDSQEDSSYIRIPGAMTKNGKAHDVPLNGFAAKVLRLWRNQSPGKFKKDSLVFAGPNGKQIHDLRRAWKSVLKAAKIEEFRFHDLRHTFASNLVMSGVSLFAVQKLLNHSSPAMTERYAKLAPKWMEQTVSKLSEDAKWTL